MSEKSLFRLFRLFLVMLAAAGLWWLQGAGESAHLVSEPLEDKHGAGKFIRSAIASHAKSSHPPERPLPADRAAANDPREAAVAQGTVMEERLRPDGTAGRWRRERLVISSIQKRPLHVREVWQEPDGAHGWVLLGRDLYLADQVIVRASPGVEPADLYARLRKEGMELVSPLGEGLHTVRLPRADLDALPEGLAALAGMDSVLLAEADGVGFGAAIPNDPSFSSQWGNHNTGQSGGVPGADVGAALLWDIFSGTPDMVVAVLDSGLNFTHPDLQGLAWANPGEIPGDGLDNDGNGRIDDVPGWDFVNADNDPTDDHAHGSHVTGIIAANRGNGTGVAGMLNGVKILTCKLLNSSNSGTTSNLIAATIYARQLGVPVMNLSLQNYPFSTTLNNEFSLCEAAGILLCICAGNQGVDNDVTPNYPSSYTHSNIIAVGNHERLDVRWSGSNYGAASVDLYAPGRLILSTVLGTNYSNFTGTSMSTPYVAAVAAAIKQLNPAWQAAQIKNSILASVVTRPAYGGICVTGGRLNALRAVAHAVKQQPLNDLDKDGAANFLEYTTGTRMDSAAAMPVMTVMAQDGFLRLAMPHASREDAALGMERTVDFSEWFETNITDFSTSGVREGGIPLDGSLGLFMRMKAVEQP